MKTNIDIYIEELKNCVFYKLNFSTGKFEYLSPNVSDLIGYTLEEVNNIGIKSIVKTIIDSESKESKIGEKTLIDLSSKYVIQTKNGETKFIDDKAYYQITGKGRGKYVYGVMIDMSSLNDFVSDIKTEKDKLASFLEITDVIFLVVDKNEKITYINKRGNQYLNCDISDDSKNLWYDYLTPENNYDILKSKFELLLNEKEVEYAPLELKIYTHVDEEKIIRWHYSVIKNEENKVSSVLFSGIDITENKRDEKIEKTIIQILNASNEESDLNEFFEFIHNSITELMPAENFYIALYDEKDKMLSFPYFVDQTEKAVSPQKFGKGLTEIVIQTGNTYLVDKKNSEIMAGKSEIKIIGSPAAVWLGVPLKIKEHTFGAMVVQDYNNPGIYGPKEKNILEVISYAVARAVERKKNEMEKNEIINELKELNASKDKLISHISHDLRSPFNSLLGFSEILTTEYSTLTEDEIKEYLQAIYDASKNLFGMTNNLLHFSRFRMGRLEFKPAELNLLNVINRNLNLLKGNAIKKQINLVLDVNKDIYVYADEDLLGSVIQNLVSNAIKFTGRQGEVSITTRYPDDHNFVEMTVKDSGIGISKNNLKKIFDEDYYSTSGTEREFGTGLGLLLVMEFVEKNGGKMNVSSKLNKGSTFQFTIPTIKNKN